MLNLFAHAGEVHDDVLDSTAHLLDLWYVTLPIYVLAIAAITIVSYYATKKSVNAAFLVLNTALLVGGLVMYQLSPTVSAVSLSLGFTMALISVLGGLKVGK